MLWSSNGLGLGLFLSQASRSPKFGCGKQNVSTMSAIKKGLRRSGARSTTRVTEPRSSLAERPKSLRINEPSKTLNRLNNHNLNRSVQPVINSRTAGYSSRRDVTKPTTSRESSNRWSRIRAPRTEERYTPTLSRPQNSNTLRLHIPGSQELKEDYDTTDVYRKVAQYDPAEAKKERRQERVARREAQDPSLSRDYIKIQLSSAASQFIYGRSSVLAALKLGHRRLYKLYVTRTTGEEGKGLDDLAKYALNRGIQIIWITNSRSQSEMDRVAKGRPHNVCPQYQK